MSPTRKPFSSLLIWSSVLALSALMAATVFSSMALASAAVPCANAVVENKTAMAPSAPIMSLRNMEIPPCSSSNLQLSCTVRTQGSYPDIAPMNSLLAPADELINRGGVAMSGFGPLRHVAATQQHVRCRGKADSGAASAQ